MLIIKFSRETLLNYVGKLKSVLIITSSNNFHVRKYYTGKHDCLVTLNSSNH